MKKIKTIFCEDGYTFAEDEKGKIFWYDPEEELTKRTEELKIEIEGDAIVVTTDRNETTWHQIFCIIPGH